MPAGFDLKVGRDRMAMEAKSVDAMLQRAVPHPGMGAAPVAPARGPMRIETAWDVVPGGTRRQAGTHGVEMCRLEIMVVQAARRHTERKPDSPFIAPFAQGQIAVGRAYRDLVEWREGSALRIASLEAGRNTGSSGGGLFIDSFIQQGYWLAELHRRIGDGVAMDVRRNMDRGNTRRPITVRALVDMVVVGGMDLSKVLERFGWQANGQNRKVLRTQLVGALDRMQGYADGPAAK
jgi:hypothetical protein